MSRDGGRAVHRRKFRMLMHRAVYREGEQDCAEGSIRGHPSKLWRRIEDGGARVQLYDLAVEIPRHLQFTEQLAAAHIDFHKTATMVAGQLFSISCN